MNPIANPSTGMSLSKINLKHAMYTYLRSWLFRFKVIRLFDYLNSYKEWKHIPVFRTMGAKACSHLR